MEWNFVYFLIAHQNKLNFVRKKNDIHTFLKQNKKAFISILVLIDIPKKILFFKTYTRLLKKKIKDFSSTDFFLNITKKEFNLWRWLFFSSPFIYIFIIVVVY